MATPARTTVSDVSYALTADTGALGVQAELLCTSLRYTYPIAPILVFIPAASYDALDSDIRQSLEAQATIVTGDFPIPEYPISAMQQALVEAADRFSTKYYVGLDSDTVMMTPLELPPAHPTDDETGETQETDLFLRPVSIGAQYWGSKHAIDDWNRLYRHYDLARPDTTITSAVDNRTIPPYYNAGVVITTDSSFPTDWLEITRDIIQEDIINHDEQFYNDQLALSIAAATRNVTQLDQRHNYPFTVQWSCPSNVQIVHYGKLRNLPRLPSDHQQRLQQYGWTPTDRTTTEQLRTTLDILSAQSGRVLPYRARTILRSTTRRLLPSRILELN